MFLKKEDPKRKPIGKKQAPPPPPPLGRRMIEFLKSIAFALVAVVILNSFVLASFQVPTGSMENTVMAGDLLFVNKFIYGGTTPPTIPILGIITGTEVEMPYFRIPGFKDPEKGDVIVFIWPGDRDQVKAQPFQYYLKRCVAVSHDTIHVVNKRLFINGAPFDNPPGVHFAYGAIPPDQIEDRIFPPGKPWNRDNYGPLVVPGAGDVIPLTPENLQEWYMFIRREGHTVAINGGTILIDGKPATSYTVQRDYVFGMGDNRDDSLDSRYWGFIPKEYVVGTPMIVYWSWDPTVPIFNLFKKLGSLRLSRLGTIIG